jgi:hypothetical protein
MVTAINPLFPNFLPPALFSAGRQVRAPSVRPADTLAAVLLLVFLTLPLPSWALVTGLHEFSSASGPTAAASIAVAVPAGTRIGDLMLAAVGARGGSDVTIGTRAGWSAIPGSRKRSKWCSSAWWRAQPGARTPIPRGVPLSVSIATLRSSSTYAKTTEPEGGPHQTSGAKNSLTTVV